MNGAWTDLRRLTPEEAEIVNRMRVLAAQSPVVLQSLIAELVVSRQVINKIRKVRRCLPASSAAYLDGLPHRRVTSREFDHA